MPARDLLYRAMGHGYWFAALLVIAGIAFQVYVTARLWRTSTFERAHKVAQAKLVWLLPVIGATIVFAVLVDEERMARAEHASDRHLRR